MRPGPSLLAGALLWTILGAAAFLFPWAVLCWALAGMALLVLALGDLLVMASLLSRVAVNRRVPESLAMGEACRVELSLSLVGGRLPPAMVEVHELLPPSLSHRGLPLRFTAEDFSSGGLEAGYQVLPVARGPWKIAGTDVLERSWLGFWKRRHVAGGASEGRSYPDFKNILRLARAELRGIAAAVGLKSRQRRGQGTDFLSLREYEPGDAVRAIDWRATSRRRRPIVRQYQDEIDQQIVFLVDSGYRLNRPSGGGRLLDRALDAVLLLSWVALKHQDSVALMSFGADERWIPPRRGPGAMAAFLRAIHDLEGASAASSPSAALERLLSRLKRRSLIVLLSNLQEEDGESLSWIMPLAARRHLVLAVNIREEEFRDSLNRGLGSSSEHGDKEDADGYGTAEAGSAPEEALERAAAFRFSRKRAALARRWEGMGILNLETDASSLSPDLVNRYLDLKKSGAL